MNQTSFLHNPQKRSLMVELVRLFALKNTEDSFNIVFLLHHIPVMIFHL